MTRASLHGLVTIPVTHCHPMMSTLHKQQLLYSALLMSHRYYSNEKQDGKFCLSIVTLCMLQIYCIIISCIIYDQ